MPPGPKPNITARKMEQRFRPPPDIELVHSDPSRAMFTVNSDASAEDIQAEIARRGDAMIDQRERASVDHWMASEPPVPLAEACASIVRMSVVDGRVPPWVQALNTRVKELDAAFLTRVGKSQPMLITMLSALMENNIDTKILKASGIYSGIESLLICPEACIRTKAVDLINVWRTSQNLFPLEVGMTAIAAHTPDRLKKIYGPMDASKPAWNGAFFGFMWAAELTRSIDYSLRLYGATNLIDAASYLLPERDSTRLKPLLDIKDLRSYFQDLRKAYPMLDGYWQDTVLSGTDKTGTLVDRWETLFQAGLKSKGGHEAYLKSYSDLRHIEDITRDGKGAEYDPVLVDALRASPEATQDHISQHLRSQHDCDGCRTYLSLKKQSNFFLQNASASLNSTMSEIEDENNYVHNRVEHLDFEHFKTWFDNSTRVCHGILHKLTKDVKELHSAWPQLLCELERNMRRVMYGEEMYMAMSETLQNMEKNVATYCRDVQDLERQNAYNDIRALRQELDSCQDGKYMPSSCDLHQIENKLMSMICRPVKALWDLESITAADQQRQIEAKTAKNDELSVQVQAKGSELSRVQGKFKESEAKLKTTKTKLEAAERAAAAKAHIEIEKQKSRYYQDVEKGVNEHSSALRSQLEAARAEGLLYRQTLADNEKLSAEMAKMKQEMAHLRAIKLRKEADCKLAEESTKTIKEGYDQLKESKATVETRNVELEADLEKALEEQDDLRNEIKKLQASKKSAAPPQTTLTDNHAKLIPTSLEEKNKKELQHLDSTIMVWRKTLTEAEAKRNATKEKKEQLDLRIAHVEKQIKELKEAKKPKTGSSSAATPPTQQPIAAPAQSTIPIIVHKFVRRTVPEQEHFPALGAATAPANALRGDAPAFSSMRIISPATGGRNTRGPAPRNTQDMNTSGSKKGNGGGQGQQGEGGWGN